MRQILMISSYVARDPVGLAAAIPPLEQAGIEVVGLPTVVLSNHPIRPHLAGMRLEPALLESMIGALEKNGWLGSFNAVFSGYLPSAQHVEIVAAAVKRLRELNPSIAYVCDPIFGDDPKGHYIDEEAAAATRDLLVPLADVLTPNRFELSWLSGLDVRSPTDALEAICRLGAFSSEVDTGSREENATDKKPSRPLVAGTSIPYGPRLATVLVTGKQAYMGSVEKWNDVPHGTGDVFAGCLTAKLMLGDSAEQALAYAIAGVRRALEASRGHDRLLPHLVDWKNGISPVTIEALPLGKSQRSLS